MKIIILFSLLKLFKNENQISIFINGTISQTIFSDRYQDLLPDIILINGVNQSEINRTIDNLCVNRKNNITLIWNTQLKNTNSMFYNISNISIFDFSNFDSSQITDMDYMFANLTSIKTIDLSNFNTSSVTSMNNMFYRCSSLTS